jgi:hypothetical protein
MQAIKTHYLPCTNSHGSRVKATAEAGSITVDWDHSLNIEENHIAAAEALRVKLDWVGPRYGVLATGWLPNNGGLCHVMVGGAV